MKTWHWIALVAAAAAYCLLRPAPTPGTTAGVIPSASAATNWLDALRGPLKPAPGIR